MLRFNALTTVNLLYTRERACINYKIENNEFAQESSMQQTIHREMYLKLICYKYIPHNCNIVYTRSLFINNQIIKIMYIRVDLLVSQYCI